MSPAGFAAIAFLAATALLAGTPGSLTAHDAGTRLEVTPPTVAVGGVLEVRGVGFGADQVVALLLVAADATDVALGSATADAEGGFSLPVAIAADVVPGPYALRALAADGDAVDAMLAVTAPDLGGGDQRGAEEPLLGPIRSGAADGDPGGVPAPGSSRPPSAAAQDPTSGTSGDDAEGDAWPLLAGALAVGALGLLAARGRRTEPPR